MRSSRVLPWPRSPSSTTSCPAISARSSCGITVSSKPCRPGHGSRPSRSAASRLSRISSRSVFCTCPEARSSPTVVDRGSWGHRFHATARGQPGRVTRALRCPGESPLQQPCPVRQRHVVRRVLRPAAPRRGAGGHRRGADALALRRLRGRATPTTSSAPGTRAPGPTTGDAGGGRADLARGSTILDTVAGGPDDDDGRGRVPRARTGAGAVAGVLHERSRFVRRAGRWVYVDGDAG